MSLAEKFKPTSQKTLFHKDIVAHIRKWIKQLAEITDNNYKLVLLLYGPIGCGKSVTVDVLFKPFNVVQIDADSLRTGSETTIHTSLLNYYDKTLVGALNSKEKVKNNVVVIDNIELCEKSIASFVNSIHQRFNIPVVLLCNDPKLVQGLKFEDSSLTLFQFPAPSLLELNKLAMDICQTEKLHLGKSHLKELITKSENDARQLFFFLDQWKLTLSGASNSSRNPDDLFKAFSSTLAVKNTDIDLVSKINYLIAPTTTIDDSYNTALSEPQTICNTLFQNYPIILSNHNDLSLASSVVDSISQSNEFAVKLYSDQMWDLYEDYSTFACVCPAHFIRQSTDIQEHTTFAPFKDMSYNFLGSFEEVKRVSFSNMFCPRLNPTKKVAVCVLQASTCFTLVSNILCIVDRLVAHFDSQKKGKNTSKKEKMDLCKALESDQSIDMNKLTELVYDYKLFEISAIDDIYTSKKEFISAFSDDTHLDTHIDLHTKYTGKIDLRILKRLLNIFTFNEGNKRLKSHVEMATKYHILKRFASDLKECSASHTPTNFSIESLTEDLSNIWNI